MGPCRSVRVRVRVVEFSYKQVNARFLDGPAQQADISRALGFSTIIATN